ncbi:YgfZ/GcvT domain-containing protein [Simiduia litorea]|uniref:CAF17-like 4Fe-4S cluster assembly/insertion protein YgfZ n=1 Tax=Simiduia litorea TaxID=1435348 RepID=UPI0036F438CF
MSSDNTVQFFTATPFPSSADLCLTELSGLTAYDLEGPDSYKFLQGQITQDTKLLESQSGFIADHCTPKGRILGTLIALPVRANAVRLIMPRDNAESLIANLKKYLVFSKATLTPVSDSQILLMHGANTTNCLQSLFELTPQERWQVATSANNHLIRLNSRDLLLSLETATATKLLKAWDASLGGWRHWQQYLIEQGIGWVDKSNSEQFTPHQINHQFIDAISFKKGCYTGQEVVARMHYKATPKSHVYGCKLESELAPELGCTIKSDTSSAGKILWRAQSGKNQWLVLAELKIELAAGRLHLDSEKAEILSRFDLPYAINK